MNLKTIVFAGPSLSSSSLDLIESNGLLLNKPIKQGDLYKIIDGFNGRIIIADGIFQHVLSIGHREILDSIKRGIEIIGVSSMGAIRAYELRDFGMIGFGKVYSWFMENEDFQDDEVSLLHEPFPPYESISEPLVHFRECIKNLVENNLLEKKSGESIISQLKEKYFGDRTMGEFRSLLLRISGMEPDLIVNNFNKFRIKKTDLSDCISHLIQS